MSCNSGKCNSDGCSTGTCGIPEVERPKSDHNVVILSEGLELEKSEVSSLLKSNDEELLLANSSTENNDSVIKITKFDDIEFLENLLTISFNNTIIAEYYKNDDEVFAVIKEGKTLYIFRTTKDRLSLVTESSNYNGEFAIDVKVDYDELKEVYVGRVLYKSRSILQYQTLFAFKSSHQEVVVSRCQSIISNLETIKDILYKISLSEYKYCAIADHMFKIIRLDYGGIVVSNVETSNRSLISYNNILSSSNTVFLGDGHSYVVDDRIYTIEDDNYTIGDQTGGDSLELYYEALLATVNTEYVNASIESTEKFNALNESLNEVKPTLLWLLEETSEIFFNSKHGIASITEESLDSVSKQLSTMVTPTETLIEED